MRERLQATHSGFFIYIQKLNQISKNIQTAAVFPKIPKPKFFFPYSTSKPGNNFSGNGIQKPDKFFPVSKSGKIYSGFSIKFRKFNFRIWDRICL